jgi:hypothetical protein
MLEVGEKKNMLTYLGERETVNRKTYGLFRCDCGKEKYIRMDGVESEHTKSCGCMRRNPYGMHANDWELLFGVYNNMMKRCYNENADRFCSYGGRGITVCDEWNGNFKTFANFAVKNGWNKNLSIERKDVNGNYEPSNVTFITMAEQARNRTSCVYVTLNGTKKCVAEWCENTTKLNAKTVYARFKRGIREPTTLLYDGDLRELRSR